MRHMATGGAPLSHDMVGAARTGDPAAISDLYRTLAPVVIGYLRGSGVADPENVAGDVFVAVIQGLPNFAGDAYALRTWVFTIAYRRIIDDRRRRRRRPEQPLGPNVVAFPTPDQTEPVLTSIASKPVKDALNRLTADQRATVLLRIVGGLSLEETAKAMNKAVPAVKMLQRRGLDALARTISREAVT
jgi:RNA polymerase sigma factor (sigma-70 family)